MQNAGQNISEGIQKAVQEYHKTQEEQSADQVLLDFFSKQGMVTPEHMATYAKGSQAAKNGVVLGLTRQFGAMQQQKQADSLEESRQASVEERQQRAALLKTKQENDILASEPPTEEQKIEAANRGYFYPFNPATQKYELTPMQGGSGGTSRPSDKVQMTIQTPDGPKQILMTGNKFYDAVTNPVKFKQNYNATQTEFSDPRKTQIGRVGEDGKFIQDPNGDQVRYNIHNDKQSGVEVDSGVIPLEEWNRVRQHAATASQATNPTATPPRGEVRGRPQPGEVRRGYKFKGGDPSKQENWEKQ